jgi:hypothetical protein
VIVTTCGSGALRLRAMDETQTVVALPRRARRTRSVVLVAGSGRSGTSLFTGIMQRLGYTVPAPEVPADDTNPRGFAESQWVVDFHTRLLRRAGVQVADARPSAWAATARVGLDAEATAELRDWLRAQLALSDHLIVKDPRVSWFAPLWRRCASELGAGPRFVTMLRHPAEVIDSKQRWYGGRQSDVSRAAGWLNQTLFTERATREAPRVFIRYEDLLEDWTRAVDRAGTLLDLELVRRATPVAMRSVHEFVDGGLRRSRGDWDRLAVPARLRDQADETWRLVSSLAGDDADPDAAVARLDALRGDYAALYAEAEGMVHSSIAAASRAPRPARGRVPGPARWVIRRVPFEWKRRIPAAWRARIIRALAPSSSRRG